MNWRGPASFCGSRPRRTPCSEPVTINVLRRAVDVNRPVTLWWVPDAVLAARGRTATGGLTSPACLLSVAFRHRSTACGKFTPQSTNSGSRTPTRTPAAADGSEPRGRLVRDGSRTRMLRHAGWQQVTSSEQRYSVPCHWQRNRACRCPQKWTKLSHKPNCRGNFWVFFE